MRKQLVLISLLTGIMGVFSAGFAAAKIPTIAVVDFGISGVSADVSRQVTQKFRDELLKSKLFNVPSRDETEKAFAKRDLVYKMKLEQIECQNVSCAVKVGVALKVHQTIIGRIVKDEKQKTSLIWAKLVNVQSSDVVFVASVEDSAAADLNELAIKLAKKVVNWMPKPGETEEQVKKRRLAQQKQDEAEKTRQREERLKKLTYRKPGTCPAGMIIIPAGEFVMGSASGDADHRQDEAKNKKVMVGEFCVDKYEYPNKKGAVPFRQAEWFAGKEECKAQGKRLCTEAEWEKACKGTKGFEYPYGNKLDQQKCNTGHKEGDKLVKGRVAKTGSYKDCVNDYGVYDMSGNVWEWVADYYNPDNRSFVLRGGSYSSSPLATRCAMRREGIAFMRRKDIGFRCCK